MHGIPCQPKLKESMIYEIYSVKDKAIGAFLRPIFLHTEAECLRQITDLVIDPLHNFHKHAKDFSLWHIGTHDESTGIITPLDDIQCIANLHDLLPQENK